MSERFLEASYEKLEMTDLLTKYWSEIVIEDCGFEPTDECVSDAAYVHLIVPERMLSEYSSRNGRKSRPCGVEFWRETQFRQKLYESDLDGGLSGANLRDALEFLGGEVTAAYHPIHSEGHVRLQIIEVLPGIDDHW